MRSTTRPLVALASAVAAGALAAAQAPSQPTFRAATELIAIDATVVNDRGEPVDDLTAADFTLTVDGQPRRIVSAQFIKQAPPGPVPTLAGRKLPFSTNETAVGSRLILIVFDLEGIGVGGGRGASVAAGRFLDQLTPSDRVGVLAFPNGVNVEFTTDRQKVRDALMRLIGRGSFFSDGIYSIGLSEAVEIDRGDTGTFARVIQRECANENTEQGMAICQTSLESQARAMAVVNRQRVMNSLQTLRSMLRALSRVDAPKTVVWISEGLALADDRVELGGLAALAAQARTTIYTLHLDQTVVADASRSRPSPTIMQDRQLAMDGLATVAGITRGTMFTSIGTGSSIFERIAREMTAYYLLSAEPDEQHRDGKTHRIKVSVNRRNVNVRARRDFTLRKEAEEPLSPEQQLAGILRQPMLATELPVKVATYNMRTPGTETVKVAVTTEFGTASAATEEAALAYVVLTDKGKVASASFKTYKATAVRPTGPGPLQATTVLEVPPGTYVLRLAVLDSTGRIGSVEHPLEAAIAAAGGIEIADLLLAPAVVGSSGAVRLIADPVVDDEPLGAYLELYPRADDAVARATVTVEVAESDDGPAIASAAAPIGKTRDKGRYVASAMLPLGLVPPGEYVARAIVDSGGRQTVQARAFRLARAVPAGRMFTAELASRVGRFDVAEVLTPALLDRALTRARELEPAPLAEPVAQAAGAAAAGQLDALDAAVLGRDRSLTAAFLLGIDRFRAGRYEDAAQQFRAAVRQSSEFLPGIFYLGACYAAGGRGREAVGAWQTSLVGDDTSPDVFELLIDGFLRLGDTDAAIGIIEEASAKWPDDYRFVLRATLAEAAQDRPGEAFLRLRPWLDRPAAGQEAFDLALRLALADLASRRPGDEDGEPIARLRELTERYAATATPLPPVATRWLAYLAARAPTQ